MPLLRSERATAALLIACAVLGLAVANTPLSGAVLGVRDAALVVPGTGLDLTVGGWVTDGLLAVFFLLAAIELRHELTAGALASVRSALVPALAAVGGVIAPALVVLLLVHDPAGRAGWPIPTATDIAFALGILAIAGGRLPTRVRALLLALAVIDDLIAIVLIAVFFTHEIEPVPLALALPAVLLFGLVTARVRRTPVAIALAVPLGLLAWYLVHAACARRSNPGRMPSCCRSSPSRRHSSRSRRCR